MIPAYARPAHRRLRAKLAEIAAFAEGAALARVEEGDRRLGIVTAGVSYLHAAEAAPAASFLKLGMVHPLPLERVRRFAAAVLEERLAAPELSLVVARRPCILAAADIRKWEKQAEERHEAQDCSACGEG